MHDAHLLHRMAEGAVHGAPVVPEHDIVVLPDVDVPEARLQRVRDQLRDQRVAFRRVPLRHLVHAALRSAPLPFLRRIGYGQKTGG